MFTKARTIKTLAVMFAMVAIVGLFNLDILEGWISFLNTHTFGYMRMICYLFSIMNLLILPVIVSLSLEYPFFQSNDKLANEFSNVVYNARNSWVALICFSFLGGIVTLSFTVGCVALFA